ncbi:MAG: efflux RND transporter permease subunit [Pseudomonadota bacterium]
MSLNQSKHSGLISWFAGNSVAANLLMFGLLFGGFLMIDRTNSEILPPIDPRALSVSVSYPGATPEEVEDAITRRAEEAVISLEGVDRVRSVASEGLGTLTIELDDFTDALQVKDDVETALDRLVNFPPEDAEEPQITHLKPISAVMRLVLMGQVGERTLRRAGESLERDLRSLDKVSIVTLQGVRDYEISIQVSQATLNQYNLSIDQVSSAIRRSSINLSGGVIRSAGGEILLRTNTEARSAESFSDIIIISDFEGRRVTLGDIAKVKDGFEEGQLKNTNNGVPAVFLQIERSAGEDAFDVANAVKAHLADYTPPPGISVLISADTTGVIGDRINLLSRNGLLGLSLVFVFLALTLDLRLAFWTSVGIPIAFLGGLILFGQFTTINMISLLGLIMVLGIVVDDAIVVGENIYEQQANGTLAGVVGAVRGSIGVFAPVMVGVLTTMIAFSTLLLSTGILGQMLRPVSIVVVCVLLISLIEVFLILPAHLSHGRDWSVGVMLRVRNAVQKGLVFIRDEWVMPIVGFSTRLPYLTVAICLAILIVFAGLFTGGHVRFVFFPTVESDEIRVELEMPPGTPFLTTERTMEGVIDAAYASVGGEQTELVKSISMTVGARLSSGFNARGTVLQSEVATATLELVPASERDISAAEVEANWRDRIERLPGIKSLTFQSAGLAGGDDVSFNLSHQDEEVLLLAAEQFQTQLAQIDGLAELQSSIDRGKRQLEFSLTPSGVAAGLSEDDLARSIRNAFFGDEVTRIQRDREEVKVFVRFPEQDRQSVSGLSNLRITLPNGEDAFLSTVATITETRSYVSIDRVDGRRVVSISGDVDEAVNTPNAINDLIQTRLVPALLRDYPGLQLIQEGQARNQMRELTALTNNFLFAVIGIYVMLASILRSYTQPFLILLIIPYGLVGAVLGHMLLGYDMTFLSLFGVVALSGVVVNDSVVLIDYYNTLQAKGGDAKSNIQKAVRRRFRPILLTTLTTFIGLVPMISETSLQARFLIPMAISLAYGIIVASVLILFLVPACVAIAEHFRTVRPQQSLPRP